jgi:hypothetical protein
MGVLRVERGTASLPPLPEPPAPAPSAPAPALPGPAARVGPEWGELEAEPDKGKEGPGSPVELAAQRALADLAESIFEEMPAVGSRPGARSTAAHLTKADLDALIGQAIVANAGNLNRRSLPISASSPLSSCRALCRPALRARLCLRAIEQFQ